MARIEKELEAESQGHVDSLWKITSVGGVVGEGSSQNPRGVETPTRLDKASDKAQ